MRMAKSHASHTPAPSSRLPVRDAGFSLIELLLVLLIFSVLTGAAMTLVVNAYKSLQGRLSSSTALDKGLRAVNQMSGEIRMAGFPSDKSFTTTAVTSSPGIVAIPFVIASAYDLTFEADTDGDGRVEQIEYVLASGSESIIRRSTLKNLNGTLATSTLVSSLFLDHVQNQTLSQPLFSWDLDPSSSKPFPQNIRAIYVNAILKPVGEQGGTASNVTLVAACHRMNP
jgi:prepilin-type N-terminal cleavage/methylation domain-containing protein